MRQEETLPQKRKKRRSARRAAALLLGLLLLTAAGCGSGRPAEEDALATQETPALQEPQPEDAIQEQEETPEAEEAQEPEEERPPLVLEEEPQQEEGSDYTLDVPVLALEIGKDEHSLSVVWEHTWTEGEFVRLWNVQEPDAYTDFPGTLRVSKDNEVKHYVAELTGLELETQYAYKIGNGEEWTRTYYFVTKPAVSDFQFIAAADPQIGASGESSEDGRAWETALNRMTEQTGAANFVLSLGDQVEDETNRYQHDLFLTPQLLKRTPVAVVAGNHDRDSAYYAQYFAMPNQDGALRGQPDTMEGAADYWFTFGDTLFLCLDTNDLNEQDHIDFMTETIERYVREHGVRPNWIIAAMHHSVFSITDHLYSDHYLERQAALAPAFSELGVDVVLMGHDHSHDRTYMMDGTTPHVVKNEDGSRPTQVQAQAGEVVYFTLNSSTGSKFYEQVEIGEMIAFNNQENVPNMTKVTVRQDKIVFTTCRVEENCSVLEEFTLLHK